jgi:hypothetical protein
MFASKARAYPSVAVTVLDHLQINFLRPYFTNVFNKLECFSLEGLFEPTEFFKGKARNLP